MINKIYLIIAYLSLILYLTIYYVYLFLSSFGEYFSMINYLVIGIFSMIFGFIYIYFQNKYDEKLKYIIKNSFYTNLILIPILILVPTILIYLVQETSKLEGFDSFLIYNMNIWILPILLIFTFNIFSFFRLYQEKEFKRFLFYLIPLGISFLIIVVFKFF